MSAAEIIETIKHLPRQEQAKVVSFIHTLERQTQPTQSAAKVSPEFRRIADEVFTTNDELFHKLAQ
jgi:mRNA-degrading endonuclease RelE of RelBE toxin-antitoxin system